MNNSSVNKSILKGFIWNFISLAIHRSFDFIIKLVLARLLFPEQFGVVAMAAVFTTFIQVLTNLGFAQAIIQRKESELRDEHYHTAFWTGIVWSILLYGIVFFVVSPLAADFYKEPILNAIIPVLSLGVLSSPVNAIQKAILTRKLDFKRISIINNIAGIFSGLLALLLAYLGFGVWALVFNSVATIVVVMPLYFFATKWTPKLQWNKQAFYDVFGFGIYTTGTNLLSNLAYNIDYLIVGKLLSSSLVGAYSLAFMITSTFRMNLITIINQVMYPVFGQFQEDQIALKKYYSKVTFYSSLLVFPIMGFFIVFRESFIINFFGDKWADAIKPLLFLAIAQFLVTMSSSFSIILRGIGKPGLEMKLASVNTFVIYLPTLFLGTYYYGIVGTSVAIIFNQFLILIIDQYFLQKLINFSVSDLVKTVYKPILLALITVSLMLSVGKWIPLPFLIDYIVYFLIYSLLIIFFLNKEARFITNYLKGNNK